jgi:hypothetical protein
MPITIIIIIIIIIIIHTTVATEAAAAQGRVRGTWLWRRGREMRHHTRGIA